MLSTKTGDFLLKPTFCFSKVFDSLRLVDVVEKEKEAHFRKFSSKNHSDSSLKQHPGL